MHFGGDFMWGTPLGMYVNGQNIGDFPQTTEWLKIRGEHLVPRDGYYDVRVHANLWETDYVDQLALIVVDHPPDTEIHVDERFFLTPTAPKLYMTTAVKPVAQAWDHHGVDVTELVRAIDGRYLDHCGRGRFQGITHDHWVEVELGPDAPTEGPLYLVAHGWTHPTNSSINVAISQGKHDAPRPLVLEVPDGKGGWKVGRPALGFPAGKNKTMLIRLDGIEGKGVSRRFRLRTNMEIFWDFLGYARGLDPKLATLHRPAPVAAELRFRGILEMTQKDASSPEVPHYDKVIRAGQQWRDLIGYYTRFGDVRELLAKADDRYVIMNASDEIALHFSVPEGLPPRWKRDFIWECDGWTRDGDLNTRFPARHEHVLTSGRGRDEEGPAVRFRVGQGRLQRVERRQGPPARRRPGLLQCLLPGPPAGDRRRRREPAVRERGRPGGNRPRDPEHGRGAGRPRHRGHGQARQRNRPEHLGDGGRNRHPAVRRFGGLHPASGRPEHDLEGDSQTGPWIVDHDPRPFPVVRGGHGDRLPPPGFPGGERGPVGPGRLPEVLGAAR
jgi:hypothetical protein